MRYAFYIQEGFINLLSSKLRSTLALLGILVGTASVVAMVSGGELATNEALKQFRALGTDLLSVSFNDEKTQDDDANTNTQNNLSFEDANNIKNANPHIIFSSPYTQLFMTIDFNGKILDGSVIGVTKNMTDVANIVVEKGRFISTFDQHAFYCVIGNTLYQNIKKIILHDPIGEQIKINNTFFTIIGIEKPWTENNFISINVDSSVMIPLQTSIIMNKYTSINNIIMRLDSSQDIDAIKQDVQSYINNHSKNKDILFRSPKELIASMTKQKEILTLFLGLVGSISLLVGGIGVMNIMLVSVIERQREIGIRLSVGATERDIHLLFLFEAILLSVIGGILGLFIGTTISYLIAIFCKWQFKFFFLPAFVGFTVSVSVGILSGFYPARRASKLHPIQALRTE